MTLIFNYVFLALLWLASVTGLSYAGVNVLVYFVLFPLIWLRLAKIGTGCYLGFWLGLFLGAGFNPICNTLFAWSVGFLQSFAIFGLNYTCASVLICVVGPIALFLIARRLGARSKI